MGRQYTEASPGASTGYCFDFWPGTREARQGRTWTHIKRPVWRPLGAHAVEFSKTVAPLRPGRGFLRHGAARVCPERGVESSAPPEASEGAAGLHSGRPA